MKKSIAMRFLEVFYYHLQVSVCAKVASVEKQRPSLVQEKIYVNLSSRQHGLI